MLDSAYLDKIQKRKLVDYAVDREFAKAKDLLGELADYREPGWIFRGHADHRWILETTIRRRVARLEDDGIGTGFAADTEKFMLEEFQRRAHQYQRHLRQMPRDVYKLEWLALMQHHGAPTRLLDWTKSPYVGAFFAVADAAPQTDSAIWVIDALALKGKAVAMLKNTRHDLEDLSADSHLESPENFDRIFLADVPEWQSVIAPIEPFTTDERLTIQQGLFLCSTTLYWPLEMTLKHMIETEPSGRPEIRRLVIRSEARLDLLRELHRMNISQATLFPGLEGFARSLSNVAELHLCSNMDPF